MIISIAHRLHLGGLRFLALRVIGALALAPVVMLFIHALLLWSPGNYFDTLGNSARLSQKTIDLLKRQFHLENEDLFARYWSWSVQAAQGNFGYSFRYDAPVARLLWDRLPTTALLIGLALVLSFGVSVSSGVWAAARPGKICDRVTLALSTLGLATPTFFLALLLAFLAAHTGFLPSGGLHDHVRWDEMSSLERTADVLRHLALPTLALAAYDAARISRIVRSEMMSVLSQDFIRTAEAKGLRRRSVLFRHALRNALNSVVTLFGASPAVIIGGVAVVERVFGLPGIGRLMLDAFAVKDDPVILASALFLTAALTTGNMIADILIFLIDPRIRIDV
jgi:peptide/nickel transport system permease protein